MLKTILFSLLVLAVSDYFIAFNTSNLQVVRAMLVAQGVIALVPYFILIGSSVGQLKRATSTQKVIYYWSILCFFYILISIVIGISNSNPIGYVIGDAYRFLIPTIVVFSLISSFSYIGREKIFETFFLAFSIHFLTICLTKLLLLFSGVFYGGGANQFLMQPFYLSIILFLLFNNKKEVLNLPINNFFKSHFTLLLILLAGIILTVLSLKREFWFIILLTILVVYCYSINKVKATLYLSIFLAVVSFYILLDEELFDLLEKRFLYTFSGDRGMDASSFERLAEIKGAFFTLFNSFPLGEFLFGLGSGAEFKLAPYYPSVKESTGSALGVYHHIHNMYVVVYFRFGLFGLGLLFFPIFYHIYISFKYKYSGWEQYYSRSILIAYIMGLISGIPANSLYGSLIYGFLIFMSVSLGYKKEV